MICIITWLRYHGIGKYFYDFASTTNFIHFKHVLHAYITRFHLQSLNTLANETVFEETIPTIPAINGSENGKRHFGAPAIPPWHFEPRFHIHEMNLACKWKINIKEATKTNANRYENSDVYVRRQDTPGMMFRFSKEVVELFIVMATGKHGIVTGTIE